MERNGKEAVIARMLQGFLKSGCEFTESWPFAKFVCGLQKDLIFKK